MDPFLDDMLRPVDQLCEVLDTFAFLSYRSKSLVDCIVVVLTKSLPQQKEPMECQSITAAQAASRSITSFAGRAMNRDRISGILLALARMNFHSRKLTHTCVNAIVGAHEDGVLHLGDIARRSNVIECNELSFFRDHRSVYYST